MMRLAGKILLFAVAVLAAVPAWSQDLDEMSLERWAQLREVERYQLKIAEELYREKKWKAAQAEYEKFLTLYEASVGAPYSQLKWSWCLLHQDRVNTAIKDGFQSVIDYWPESPDAHTAALLIGRSYKSAGDVKKAERAYHEVLENYPKELVAVLARVDLIDLAKIAKDEKALVKLWQELTFDIERSKSANRYCVDASRDLCQYYCNRAAFDKALESLDTTYDAPILQREMLELARTPISNLTGDDKTQSQGVKLADDLIAYFKETMPADLNDEQQKQVARTYWNYIASTFSYSRRPEEVPKTYEQMAKIFGTDDALLGDLAGWYKSQNRYEEARATYARFADKFAGQANIAQSWRDQKKYPEAISIYARLAADDPERSINWQSQQAMTFREAGKPAEAVAVYQSLVQEDAEHGNDWLGQIAWTYWYANMWKEAIGAFRVWDSFPTDYWYMAAAHRHLKQYKEAQALYAQIMGAEPSWASRALFEICQTMEQAGDVEKAKDTYRQVCKRFPKTGEASRAHAILQDKYKITVTLGGTVEGEK